jgi:hypothetical protein
MCSTNYELSASYIHIVTSYCLHSSVVLHILCVSWFTLCSAQYWVSADRIMAGKGCSRLHVQVCVCVCARAHVCVHVHHVVATV